MAWCVCAAPPPGSFSHVTLRVTNGEDDAALVAPRTCGMKLICRYTFCHARPSRQMETVYPASVPLRSYLDR